VREIVPMKDFAKGPTHWRWQHAMSKLRLWELTDWETIVFVDADFVFLKNPDRLFKVLEKKKGMRGPSFLCSVLGPFVLLPTWVFLIALALGSW
jgi:hypothetical protein